jgi:predicted dehydrogenase
MKIAVIGVGRMGRRHVHVVQDLGLSLVGICDQNPDALKICQQENNVSSDKHYTSVEQMLKKTHPDCVVVATTSPMHSDYTCLAADSGAHYILCEKPMAISLAQCNRMIAVCKKHGACLAVNHQMRFMEQYTEPKKIIYSDAFGGLSSVMVVGGNFGMAMNGTHYFEMFRYMTNEEPHEVTAWFSAEKVPNPRGPQFEDRAGSVRITTVQGKRLSMDISADQGHGIKVIYTGRYGQLVMDELKGEMFLSVRKEEERNLPTTRYGSASLDIVKKIQPADATSPTKSVLNALIHKTNYPTGEEGRLAVATLVAAYCSDEQGHKPVIIEEKNLPADREFPWA